MPGIRRGVAYLRFREGWTNRMIAGYLGTRPGTVAMHVSDACADLKKALPELAMADARAGPLLAGRRHHGPEGRCGYRARAGSAVCRLPPARRAPRTRGNPIRRRERARAAAWLDG